MDTKRHGRKDLREQQHKDYRYSESSHKGKYTESEQTEKDDVPVSKNALSPHTFNYKASESFCKTTTKVTHSRLIERCKGVHGKSNSRQHTTCQSPNRQSIGHQNERDETGSVTSHRQPAHRESPKRRQDVLSDSDDDVIVVKYEKVLGISPHSPDCSHSERNRAERERSRPTQSHSHSHGGEVASRSRSSKSVSPRKPSRTSRSPRRHRESSWTRDRHKSREHRGSSINSSVSTGPDDVSDHHRQDHRKSADQHNRANVDIVQNHTVDHVESCQVSALEKSRHSKSYQRSEAKTEKWDEDDLLSKSWAWMTGHRPFQLSAYGVHTKRSHGNNATLHGKESFRFRVVSYNVLSQDLIYMNSHLYYHCRPEHLDWEYRQRNFRREFTDLNADVLCLQEVHHIHYREFFEPYFTMQGYQGYYIKRSGDKNDGCATFVRTSVFSVDQFVPVKYLHPGVPLLDRDNVALLALLSHVDEPATKLCVSNTHLLFNPRRGDVKLAQLMLLLAEIDKLACRSVSPTGAHTYHPVVMCGDFNATPHCDLYWLLVQGWLEYEGLMIADMTRQEEQFGQPRYLPRDLQLEGAGITDQCRYQDVVQQREQTLTPGGSSRNVLTGTGSSCCESTQNVDHQSGSAHDSRCHTPSSCGQRSSSHSSVGWTLDTTGEDWDVEIEQAKLDTAGKLSATGDTAGKGSAASESRKQNVSERKTADHADEKEDKSASVKDCMETRECSQQHSMAEHGGHSKGREAVQSQGQDAASVRLTDGTRSSEQVEAFQHVHNQKVLDFEKRTPSPSLAHFHQYGQRGNHGNTMSQQTVTQNFNRHSWTNNTQVQNLGLYFQARSPYGSLWTMPIPLGLSLGRIAFTGSMPSQARPTLPNYQPRFHRKGVQPLMESQKLSKEKSLSEQLTFNSGKVSHELSLCSVYTHGSSGTREVTTCHSRANCTVDYIFYSTLPDRRPGMPRFNAQSITGGELRLVGSKKLFTDQEMSQYGGLPSNVASSDHLSLSADFALGFNNPLLGAPRKS